MLVSGGSIYVGDSAITKVYQGEDLIWPTTPTPSEPDWLTLTIVKEGEIYFKNRISGDSGFNFYAEIEYNKNNEGWKTLNSGDSLPRFHVRSGDIVKLRADGHRKVNSSNYSVFYEDYDDGDGIWFTVKNNFSFSDAYFNISGNILSMEYGSGFTGQTTTSVGFGAFGYLFERTNVVDASELILPEYRQYFNSALEGLFYNCSTLVSAPVFSSKQIPSDYMFYKCGSLNYIKCLFYNPYGKYEYTDWLYGVAPSGRFVKAAEANWKTGANGIPEGWIIINE